MKHAVRVDNNLVHTEDGSRNIYNGAVLGLFALRCTTAPPCPLPSLPLPSSARLQRLPDPSVQCRTAQSTHGTAPPAKAPSHLPLPQPVPVSAADPFLVAAAAAPVAAAALVAPAAPLLPPRASRHSPRRAGAAGSGHNGRAAAPAAPAPRPPPYCRPVAAPPCSTTAVGPAYAARPPPAHPAPLPPPPTHCHRLPHQQLLLLLLLPVPPAQRPVPPT